PLPSTGQSPLGRLSTPPQNPVPSGRSLRTVSFRRIRRLSSSSSLPSSYIPLSIVPSSISSLSSLCVSSRYPPIPSFYIFLLPLLSSSFSSSSSLFLSF